MARRVIRISEKLYQEVKNLSSAQGVRSEVVFNRVLSEGLRRIKEKYVLDLYRDRRISLEKAAEMLNSDLWTMLEKLSQKDIHLDYSLEELEEDLSQC